MSDSSLSSKLASRARILRRRGRRRLAPAIRWMMRARLDFQDARHGRRDPLLPPRRLNLPSQTPAVGERLVELMIDPGGMRPDADVLDIGCGPGRSAAPMTRYLDPSAAGYEGFDVMPRSIAWCQKAISSRHPNFRFQLADLHNAQYNPDGSRRADEYVFPYPDASFDIALAGSLFTHLRPYEAQRYLAETARVLRPGGCLLGTWFLLNEEAEELLGRGLGRRQAILADGRPPLDLAYSFADARGNEFRSPREDVPEFMIVVPEVDVRAQHERAGLRIVETRYGHWAGRPDASDRLGQDVVLAERVET